MRLKLLKWIARGRDLAAAEAELADGWSLRAFMTLRKLAENGDPAAQRHKSAQ